MIHTTPNCPPQLAANDAVSTCLCNRCWRQLTEIDHFCSMVADKQRSLHRSLQLKTELPELPELAEPEPAMVVWNTESPIEPKAVSYPVDIVLPCRLRLA